MRSGMLKNQIDWPPKLGQTQVVGRAAWHVNIAERPPQPPLRWGSRWWFACCVDLVMALVDGREPSRGPESQLGD